MTSAFSRRSAFEHELSAFGAIKARARAAQLELSRRPGVAFYDLTLSNPTAPELGLGLDDERLARALSHPSTGRYAADARGALRAREALALELGVDAERLLLTASTSEAYAHLLTLLCDPGETVLAPTPSYPLLAHLAQLRDVQLRDYPLVYDGSWSIDPGPFRAACHGARAILAVSPNNPTGSCLEAADHALLVEANLPLIVDEVFAAYPLIDASPPPAPAHPQLRVRLGGLSKHCGLPQIKLGWMILEGPEAAVSEAHARLEILLDTFLSVSASATADLGGILEAGAHRRIKLQARVRENYAALERLVRGSPLTLRRAQAGWHAILRLPRVCEEMEYVERCLDAGVLVQPGWLYDLEDGPHVVLSLITRPDVLEAGVTRLAEVSESA